MIVGDLPRDRVPQEWMLQGTPNVVEEIAVVCETIMLACLENGRQNVFQKSLKTKKLWKITKRVEKSGISIFGYLHCENDQFAHVFVCIGQTIFPCGHKQSAKN